MGAINLETILGPASLEQKLRLMQKQLLEMTDIPVQIQSKIAMVTKALEQFMTMDPDALESSFTEQDESSSSEKQFSSNPEEIDDIESGVNNAEECSQSFDHFEIEHSTRETSFSLEDFEEQYRKHKEQHEDESAEVEKSNDDDDDDYSEDEKSICGSEVVKSEEALRLEEEKRKKNEKILKLEKSWQKLCTNTKTIHKWVRSCEGCFCAIKPSKSLKFSLIFAAKMLCARPT